MEQLKELVGQMADKFICNTGQTTVYAVYKNLESKFVIAEHEIQSVLLDEKGLYFVVYDKDAKGEKTGYIFSLSEKFGDMSFLTREAAEARIAQLTTANKKKAKAYASVTAIVDNLVELMFNDDVSHCKVSHCHKGSNIGCGSRVCIEENKQI